jgi:hypothetical protein
MQSVIEAAVWAGMSLAKFDSRRSAVVLTPDNLRGHVKRSDLRVPENHLSKSVGADGAELVAWAQRGKVVGVVWRKGEKVRYNEGAPKELLPAAVIAVMTREGWA